MKRSSALCRRLFRAAHSYVNQRDYIRLIENPCGLFSTFFSAATRKGNLLSLKSMTWHCWCSCFGWQSFFEHFFLLHTTHECFIFFFFHLSVEFHFRCIRTAGQQPAWYHGSLWGIWKMYWSMRKVDTRLKQKYDLFNKSLSTGRFLLWESTIYKEMTIERKIRFLIILPTITFITSGQQKQTIFQDWFNRNAYTLFVLYIYVWYPYLYLCLYVLWYLRRLLAFWFTKDHISFSSLHRRNLKSTHVHIHISTCTRLRTSQ